ncbi:MAG: hypothetical protein QM784_26575 [Polyangiaceae bacterium]
MHETVAVEARFRVFEESVEERLVPVVNRDQHAVRDALRNGVIAIFGTPYAERASCAFARDVESPPRLVGAMEDLARFGFVRLEQLSAAVWSRFGDWLVGRLRHWGNGATVSRHAGQLGAKQQRRGALDSQ